MTNDLTGVWDGTYIQPSVGMVTFLTTLIETGGALSGSVTEPCMRPSCPASTHFASIAGQRSGHAVSFVKTYDPPGYGYDKVSYEGTVNADATEISGRAGGYRAQRSRGRFSWFAQLRPYNRS